MCESVSREFFTSHSYFLRDMMVCETHTETTIAHGNWNDT